MEKNSTHPANPTIQDRPNPKATVAFVVFYPFQYYVYRNVYRHLAEEAEFVVDLGTFFPKEQPTDLVGDIVELLRKNGVYFRVLQREDYYIAPYLEGFFSRYVVLVSTWMRGCMLLEATSETKKVHMTYGAGKELTTFGLWKRNFDLILAYGEFDQRFYSSITNSVVVGNPKFDDWFSKNFDQDMLGSLRPRLNPAWTTVLYLPTHSDLSSIRELAATLKSLGSRYNVVVKLHYYTPREEPELVDLLTDERIILLKDDADLLSLLSVSDVVLSDNSSAIFDAVLADKPIVVTDFHDEGYFDTEHQDQRVYRRGAAGALTYSGSIEQRIKKEGVVCVIDDPSGLESAIQMALRDMPEMQARRQALCRNLFAYTDDQSGERGAVAIRKLLADGYPKERPFLYHAVQHLIGAKSRQSGKYVHRGATAANENAGGDETAPGIQSTGVIVFDVSDTPAENRAISLRSIAAQAVALDPEMPVSVVSDATTVSEDLQNFVSAQSGSWRTFVGTGPLGLKLEKALLEMNTENIFFTTTQCIVPSTWVATIDAAFRENPDTVAVGGYTRKETALATVYDGIERAKLERSLGIWSESRRRKSLYAVRNSSLLQNPAGTMKNIAYRRDFLRSLSLNWLMLTTLEHIEAFFRHKGLQRGSMEFWPVSVTDQEVLSFDRYRRLCFNRGIVSFLLARNYPRSYTCYHRSFGDTVRLPLLFFLESSGRKFRLSLSVGTMAFFEAIGYFSAHLLTLSATLRLKASEGGDQVAGGASGQRARRSSPGDFRGGRQR